MKISAIKRGMSVKRGTKARVSSYYGLQTVCTIAPFPFNLVIVKKNSDHVDLHIRDNIKSVLSYILGQLR